jgi:hypothetical protein
VDNTLRPEAVSPLFRGRFGHPYIYRPSCPSTQELVRGLDEGAVGACEQQTEGRGRMGRRWTSPWGTGVLFSLALAPHTPPDRLPPLGLVVAEAVCEATWPDAQVRWPNDVVAAVEARYRRFERDGFAGIERDELRGRFVELAGGARGCCEGVDASGRLVVDGVAHTSAEVTTVLVGADGGHYTSVDAEAECQDGS